jgi:hypothetical protein
MIRINLLAQPLDNVRHRTVTAIMKYKTPNTARIAIRPKSRS